MKMERGGEGAAFNEAYASLNAAQRDAVDTIEGPVMVIAGPGTGKTQILTLRIANILLQSDAAPESILALTFTESGAKAMRERLRRYIGTRAYRVPIYTFHGLCGDLVGRYPDAYPGIIGGMVASEIDKIQLLESIVLDPSIKLLRPSGDPSYYVKPLLSIISSLKQENIGPDQLVTIIGKQEEELATIEQFHQKGAHKGKVRSEYTKKEQSIAKNRELLFVYQRYSMLLRAQHLYDFDDMIIETIEALEHNEEMLRDLQEQYQYVLADEHQDVNGAQNRILELLTSYHQSPNIFVVGDEKQAIYRFQGASLENFLYFEDVYKGTKMISLTDNYRSGQRILDVAHSLVTVEEGPLQDLRVPLQAALSKTAAVTKTEYSHQAVEHDDLVTRIQAEIAAGTPTREIAVIVRTNREVEYLAGVLRAAGIAANASADGDILHHPITREVMHMLAAITKPENEAALFAILHGSYWNISASDLMSLLRARSFDTPLERLIRDETLLQEAGVRDVPAVLRVGTVLDAARAAALSANPSRVLAQTLEQSGFVSTLMIEDPLEGSRVLRRLYDEIEALVAEEESRTLADIVEVLATYQVHAIGLTAPFITSSDDAVSVMTAHKSKGLEFIVIFLPHLNDNVWGGTRKRTLFSVPLTRHQHDEYDAIDDERRLFYVALTRAKERVFLSYATTDAAGRALVCSRLYDELDQELVTEVPNDSAEQAFDPTKVLQGTASVPYDNSFLQQVLVERGFSATSLNNFLQSPWNYFYRNVLRVPEVQTESLQFGTAVHGVLETMTRTYTKQGSLPTDTEITQSLDRELGRLPLSVEEFTRLHQKGIETLLSYKTHLASSLSVASEEEKNIRVMFPTGLAELPEVLLTGKLDRLDKDATGKVLRVVDYKTGKPRTRGAIEGKTKSSDGGYKRQLVFYALLLSLYDDERYKTRESMLSFVQADGKGVVHEETFTITDDEIEALKGEIQAAVRVLCAGEWLTAPIEAGSTNYEQLASAFQKRLVG